MLNKTALKNSLYDGFRQIMEDQAASAVNGDEQADPADIIANICERMSSVVSDAVEQYVKSGDIRITSANITVTAPNGACTVTPADPAKLQ